jgi:CheY-like chemotaxis protein
MVVEDEVLIAMLIEDMLLDGGHEVVGPFNNLADALGAAHVERVDVALLDVNLRGERVYPVAEALERRGIPFLLLSGYGADAVPRDRAHWAACSKPFMPGDLARHLAGLVA